MGKPTAGGVEQAFKVLTGTLGAVGAGGWVEVRGGGDFNCACYGTYVGTVAIEKSYDGGTTAVPVSKDTSGTAATFTAPFSVLIREPEAAVLFRVNCTAYTSGTINWRISQ